MNTQPIQIRSLFCLLASVALGAALLAAPAAAFRSVAPNIHGQITKAGLQSLGFTSTALGGVVTANFYQDYGEVSVHLFGNHIRPNQSYNPAHHFDRNVGETSAFAARRGCDYVESQRQEIIADLQSGDVRGARQALGRALHALQDFFAHSNYVDLPPEQQQQCLSALSDPNGSFPEDLKMTGYDRTTGGDIVGDPYGHDAHCKDGPDTPEGRLRMADGETKYQHANADATEATKTFAEAIQAQVTQEEWDGLIGTGSQRSPIEGEWYCPDVFGKPTVFTIQSEGDGYGVQLSKPNASHFHVAGEGRVLTGEEPMSDQLKQRAYTGAQAKAVLGLMKTPPKSYVTLTLAPDGKSIDFYLQIDQIQFIRNAAGRVLRITAVRGTGPTTSARFHLTRRTPQTVSTEDQSQ